MFSQDQNLEFLQSKIKEIKIAMFKAEIDSVLQLPNNIVSTIKTDDHGNIWFFTSCNNDYAKNIDKHFYAHLDFYQKGSNHRLRIGGKASIVEGSDEFDSPSLNDSKVVLIKLNILQAEYFENKNAPKKGPYLCKE